jgi:hypothetical protein
MWTLTHEVDDGLGDFTQALAFVRDLLESELNTIQHLICDLPKLESLR